MPPFKVTLAYDGSGFVGWQRQAAGVSIQGLLEEALRDLDRRDVAVVGASRTDAGVHALGQVASFVLDRPMTPEGLVGALNARLPETVRVLAAEPAAEGFHARFHAAGKTYRYRIWNRQVASPFDRQRAWHVPGALDRQAMAAAARLVEGRHDFASFRAAGSSTVSTERFVVSSRLSADTPVAEVGQEGAEPALVTYEIAGDGFLRHMVRTVVGTLVEIGRGRHPVPWMREVIAARDRGQAGPTAPACGLFLVAVHYDPAFLRLNADALTIKTSEP